ncbi:MAG: HDOD domain-containing protein [Verrucomicrobiota bacterium]|nr:HDOD domain-containing protein [Verrucomicrobiota bacterium]
MNIQDIVDSDVKLPPSPQILPKLQKLLRDPNCGLQEIITLVKVDAALTALIIRNSNAAYLAMRQPSSNLEEAIIRIGLNQTYRVVSTSVAKQLLQDALPLYRIGKGELLKEAICHALFLTSVGERRFIMDPESAYTIGILHGLGKVIINQYFLKRNVEVYGAADGPVDYLMEQKLLGFDNAQIAAAMLKKWNFPKAIYEPIRYQYTPKLGAPMDKAPTALLAVAAYVVPQIFERGLDTVPPVYIGDPILLTLAGITEEDFIEGVLAVREGIQEYEQLLAG